MRIRDIKISDYQSELGQNESQHRGYLNRLPSLIRDTLVHARLDKVTLHNMNGVEVDFHAGRVGEWLYIYNDISMSDAWEEQEDGFKINGIQTPYTKINLVRELSSEQVAIKSEEGLTLAVYDKEHEQLNILFDLLGEPYTDTKDLFTYIMTKVNEQVFKVRELENSWVHGDKERLKGILSETVNRSMERDLSDKKDRARSAENDIENYIGRLRRQYENLATLRREIDNFEKASGEQGEKVINELDLVTGHSKIKDVHIENGKFHVFTETLYTYTESNERFLLGEIEMVIEMGRSRISIMNRDNARQGYWTRRDPHPHVDGGEGSPCWGTTAPIVAELSATGDLYPLVLTVIDFLESANTDDVAGRNIVAWDKVDEEGNIIRDGRPYGEFGNECWGCGGQYDREHLSTAFTHVDSRGDISEERLVCEDCLFEHFEYSDDHEEYVNVSL